MTNLITATTLEISGEGGIASFGSGNENDSASGSGRRGRIENRPGRANSASPASSVRNARSRVQRSAATPGRGKKSRQALLARLESAPQKNGNIKKSVLDGILRDLRALSR